ncbi:pyruvate kinase [Solirubrobacter sp. CPCC 204708]|uniref:Pyruvate kinase n=1 Tax=Solirubrobacter deserti TaxID=2282478 RepID=A0ABT4RU24_9ACTN|nr:pyruvate kinase [Solirubrobacter deserti]MBE2316247.1 pyruvate kinase [Solirubrobacter deserti]MDA0142073.1 pyruvate kinase [Solirubrobacter deserti]
MLERRTKIVATLGPATDGDGMLDRLVAAGLDCARLNCSHGTHDELRQRAAAVREAGHRAGRPLGLLFDLQGPKLRLSGDVQTQTVEVGDVVTFSATAKPDAIKVEFDKIAALVTERSQIVIGDGVPRFAVERVDGEDIVARAVSPGPISPRKGINVTYARPELPAITEKDEADLALAVEMGADFIALSFVRSAADMQQLREMAVALGSKARLVAKVEKIEAYEALDEIVAASDGVMVARGDYGVEAGVARVPLMQKDTIRRATQAGKFVITATQMLESMIQAPEPTRAEAADVANAVIDGTSAVMMSAETSVGAYPLEAVTAMATIALAAEESPLILGRAKPTPQSQTSHAVMQAAVELAEQVDAAALVIPTATGGGARICAKYRKRRPIIALAHAEGVADQLTLEWGVYPTTMETADSVDEMIETALTTARDWAGLEPGARVVLTSGRRTGTPGATNLVMVREIP